MRVFAEVGLERVQEVPSLKVQVEQQQFMDLQEELQTPSMLRVLGVEEEEVLVLLVKQFLGVVTRTLVVLAELEQVHFLRGVLQHLQVKMSQELIIMRVAVEVGEILVVLAHLVVMAVEVGVLETTKWHWQEP
jgi:hypothetical protein